MSAPSTTPVPVSLKGDAEGLTITWSDDLTQRWTWRRLRDACPCATCRAEREQPPKPAALFTILKPGETLALKATGMRPLGNYAYNIQFSDEHSTGIYSLEYLRGLSP
jgi:DUF971 family protein